MGQYRREGEPRRALLLNLAISCGWTPWARCFATLILSWGPIRSLFMAEFFLDRSPPTVENSLILAGLLATWAAPSAQADGIYWTNIISNTIGRANLDGTGVNESFVSGATGLPYGIAVDGTYIYWSGISSNAIGRTNLDGTGANPSFISGGPIPQRASRSTARTSTGRTSMPRSAGRTSTVRV